MTAEERITELEGRVENLTEVVRTLISRLDSMAIRQQPKPALRNDRLSPYKDAVYKIVGRIYKCSTRGEFNLVRADYLKILNDVKKEFDNETYQAFKDRSNTTTLEAYNKKKKEWPVDHSEEVLNKTVPLTRECKYDFYFKTSDEAVDYIIENAESEEHAKECAIAFCRCFGGLNEAAYVNIITNEWKSKHQNQ